MTISFTRSIGGTYVWFTQRKGMATLSRGFRIWPRSAKAIKARLEYLRGEIDAERISYSELAELQNLAAYIDPSDVQLLEWAGVPEFPEEA